MSLSVPISVAGGSFSSGGISLLGSANKFLASSATPRTQEPHIIGYPDGWRKGPTEEWYQSQQVKKFTHLQYRKEREAPFHHEYIVLEMAGGDLVCRFDRRGDIHTRASTFTTEGMKAVDTAHIISTTDKEHYAEINDKSDLVLRIHFPQGQDLLTVLGVCFGVQADDHTRSYKLTSFNCYFLSWTIITVTARRTVDWALLSKDDALWESLVKYTMDGLTSEPLQPGKLAATAKAISILGFRFRHKKSRSSPADKPTPTSASAESFNGTDYLLSILRRALVSTRLQIETSLAELILRSTVQDTLHDIAYKPAQAAADNAARVHASRAARDAAMESIMENMWQMILGAEQGGQLWEDRCRATEECVWKASAAAADAASHKSTVPRPATPPGTPSRAASVTETELAPTPVPPPTTNWESAWDQVWTESWATLVAAKNQSTGSETSRDSISARAKKAWHTAWTNACRANEKYVPRIGAGVARYAMDNLPDSLPEVLAIDPSVQSSMRTIVKALTSGSSNAELQEWIQQRIQEHCQRVAPLANSGNRGEIEDAMRRVWVATMALDTEVYQI